jgi:hypothetical protein
MIHVLPSRPRRLVPTLYSVALSAGPLRPLPNARARVSERYVKRDRPRVRVLLRPRVRVLLRPRLRPRPRPPMLLLLLPWHILSCVFGCNVGLRICVQKRQLGGATYGYGIFGYSRRLAVAQSL